MALEHQVVKSPSKCPQRLLHSWKFSCNFFSDLADRKMLDGHENDKNVAEIKSVKISKNNGGVCSKETHLKVKSVCTNAKYMGAINVNQSTIYHVNQQSDQGIYTTLGSSWSAQLEHGALGAIWQTTLKWTLKPWIGSHVVVPPRWWPTL